MTYIVRPDAVCGHVVDETDGVSSIPFCWNEDESQQASGGGGPVSAVGGAAVGGAAMANSSASDPVNDLPTLDLMVVYTPEAQTARGGSNGMVGYANNMVHEMDLILLRSGARTHKPRLVKLTLPFTPINDPTGTWSSSDPGVLAPARDSVRDDPLMDALRDDVGADLIMVLLSQGYENLGATPSLGPISDDPGLVANPNRGYAIVSSGPQATGNWSFPHELWHTMDIRHTCATGNQCWLNGYDSGSATAYANTITNPVTGQTFRYTDVMASSGVPNPGGGNPITCKVPVLSRPVPYGWTPDPGTVGAPQSLCGQNNSLANFDPNGVKPALGPLIPDPITGNPNGLVVGSTTSPHQKADIFGYLTRIWDNGRTAHEIVADWKAETVPGDDGVEMIGATPGTLAHPTNTSVTLYWPESFYALTVTDPPCYPPAICDPDVNPYYVTLGTALGGADVYDGWIGTDMFGFSQGGDTWYSVAVVLPNLVDVFYGRLWTQVAANDWRYTEFRVNHGDTLMSCDTEEPLLSPDPNSACTGAVTFTADYSFDTAPGPPSVVVDLEDGPAVPYTVSEAVGTHYDVGLGHTPYDAVLYGVTDQQQAFCCLVHWSDNPSFGVELQGSDRGNVLSLSGGNASMGTTLAPGDTALLAGINGRMGDDLIIGPAARDIDFDGRGSWGADIISIPPAGAGIIRGGPEADILIIASDEGVAEGKYGVDTLVATEAPYAPGATTLAGMEGADELCTLHGEVTLFANDTPAATADQLYVSSTWTGPTMAPSQTNSTNASCGSTVHNGLGAWAGTCSYTLTAPPQTCELFGVSP